MFDTILVANRGEIACRVIRTARRLGIRTVAVHSDADASALHVRMADEAVALGPAPVTQSYLNRAAVLDAARRTGAQAIHPGYGLLSEDPAFVGSCEEEGIVFIGPGAEAMQAIGHKIPARAQARAAGVPVVPGEETDLDDTNATEVAERVGYPLILKASAGGGGIGMTVVQSSDQLAAAVKRAVTTAERVFGDRRVYIERYLPSARHVEVQVLGGPDGRAIHLLHRDCSVQRRHQKVVEEAPAPNLAPATSEGLTAAAVRLVDSIGYRNAGTVEFIVSGDDFYFLEVNARLQVEHPVTELTTGLDLVEAQIRIAAGEPLPLRQEDVAPSGHSIECRIYAEDPRTSVPSPGTLTTFAIPLDEGVRLDTGYEAGDTITPYYDPLIAKLIVHGADRPHALERMRAVLDECVVEGVKTNVPLLRQVAADDEFRAGIYDTGLVDRIRARG